MPFEKQNSLIIPLYNQADNFHKIVEGIEKQTVLPDMVLVVLDRPSQDDRDRVMQIIDDSTYSELFDVFEPETPSNITRTSDGELFLTPYIRNEGIKYVDRCGYSDVIFFVDGDCIPQPTFIESHLKVCSRRNPVISIGRRRESQYKWNDRREHQPDLSQLKLFRNGNYVINDPAMLIQGIVLWSCNMALNKGALDRLYRFNMRYYQVQSEAFLGAFTGAWGGEDTFMGIEAWHCRIMMVMVGSKSAGVTHIDHPRPSDIYNVSHMKFVETQRQLLRKKIKLNPLPVEFFD